MVLTCYPVLKRLYFRVGLIDSLFEMKSEVCVLVTEHLAEVPLEGDVVRCLVSPKTERSSSAFHYDVGRETAQHD